MSVSAEWLREAVSYDPATGDFARCGKRVGWVDENGYVKIQLGSLKRRAHRLAWLFVHGEEALGQIDHINGDKSDNRIENLRVVTNQENQQNVKHARANSKTGILGVVRVGRRFGAYIWHNGGQRYIGAFDSTEQASQAYFTKKAELHKGYVS
jgi:hypothetical protein